MPSFEGNPSIAGNLIAFESRTTIGGINDLFVYNITTNLLHQITDTPEVNEHLNDITVSSGLIRMVWSSDEDGTSARNIRVLRFRCPRYRTTTATAYRTTTTTARQRRTLISRIAMVTERAMPVRPTMITTAWMTRQIIAANNQRRPV